MHPPTIVDAGDASCKSGPDGIEYIPCNRAGAKGNRIVGRACIVEGRSTEYGYRDSRLSFLQDPLLQWPRAQAYPDSRVPTPYSVVQERRGGIES